VTHVQCTAALFKEKCIVHCSLGDNRLLSLHLHLGRFVVHKGVQGPCSTVQGRIASLLFGAALQDRLTAGTVSLHLHLCRCVLYALPCHLLTGAVQRKRKEKFMLFSDHSGSLLRRQPGAMTIGHSPKGKENPKTKVDQAYSVWLCLSCPFLVLS